MKLLKLCLFAVFFVLFQSVFSQSASILPADWQTGEYFSLLKNKRVALVANHSSMLGQVHLLDTLLSSGIKIQRIFCPEHGFRGNIGAGERVKNQKDAATGIKIISLYGRNHKPKPTDLTDVDIVLFDIQDVGVRFYTYISTLHYVMEACAENGKQLIVLDRPNPNGFYIGGPVLDLKYKSFVGLHPVPVVYGMTIGEYAQMVNGEGWLKNSVHCNLTVIQCLNYTHQSRYELPEKPSPNLPNIKSIYLYPSLALFEGTCINVGRGTPFPFQVFGHPQLDSSNITYTPKALPGAENSPHIDTICKGIDLREYSFQNDSNYFTLKWLLFAYKHYPWKEKFFNRYLYNLIGNGDLINQIEKGEIESEIEKTWIADIDSFKKIREKYLLYK